MFGIQLVQLVVAVHNIGVCVLKVRFWPPMKPVLNIANPVLNITTPVLFNSNTGFVLLQTDFEIKIKIGVSVGCHTVEFICDIVTKIHLFVTGPCS